jgi:ligand-binding sensor domain-containing protein
LKFTQNGLQRYDGNPFLTFRHIPGDSLSITENSINHLYIDRKERLWVLFDNQLGIFNTVQFSFMETKVHAPVSMIKKIIEDREGNIILLAGNSQFLYDETKHAFTVNYPLPPLPAGYTIGDMVIDPSSGNYWLTGKQGSFLYHPKSKQFAINDPSIDSLVPVKNARYPFIAKDGVYWMVNWVPFTAAPPMVYSYDKKNSKLQRFERIRAYKADSYYEVWGIFQQSNGTIWLYGMGLLAYYDPSAQRFIHINSDPFKRNGIDYDMVSNLYEDKEKNVWVCTNKGLYRFNVDAQVFRNIPNKRSNDTTKVVNGVSSIVQTQNNGTWIGTWGTGIFSYNDQWQPIANPVTEAAPVNKALHVSSMIQRRNGEVWIGLQTGEIKIYDPATNNCGSLLHSLLINRDIPQQICEDHNGSIWIGTNSGLLLKCQTGKWKDSSSFKTILSDVGDIFKLYEDNQKHLWVCTAITGVYKLDLQDDHILKQFKETGGKNDGLLNGGASDIIQYNDSLLLIAGDGLCILNNKTNSFRYLTAADGLPAEHITTLTIDKQKRLWVGCDGGLYRLNIDNKLFVAYDDGDGITENVFQVSSDVLLNDGRIAIGTPHDFLVFDPEKTIDRNDVPAVSITGFAMGTENLSVDSLQQLEKIILPYDKTFISIELSTLSFHEHYNMYYMLDGLDKTWKKVYNEEIIYQYLPPGNYSLKLKSQNGDGRESKKITVLQIHVDPPFWKTWWFYSLLVLCIGGIIFWFDHARMKRRETVLKMRSNIADGLHKDLNAALSNITILSEMAKMKADTEPEKSKEFIEQIHTKSQDMTVAMDDILWSIDPGNDSMENFILRYREYIDALKSQYAVQVDLLVDKKVADIQLTMKIRSDVFWLFKSGIRNIIKAGGRNCRIHIAFEKHDLIYTLEFDTAAMDIQQLNNLRQRKELTDKLKDLGASLQFKQHIANAVFVLILPIKRNEL